MKEYIKDNVTLPISLHDTFVTQIDIQEDNIIFDFKDGYYKVEHGDAETTGKSTIVFSKVDLDFCTATVIRFKRHKNEKVAGKRMELTAFIKKYPNLEFEIIDEMYGYNQSIFIGELKNKKELYTCYLQIYHFGKAKYNWR